MTDDRTPHIILASSSPRRQELIRMLGLPVLIRPADVDETVGASMAPAEMVETLALRKAAAVAPDSLSGGTLAAGPLVVGSDTIVVLDGEVLGKPDGPDDAKRMLSMLQGRTHEVYTGLACLGPRPSSGPAEHSPTEETILPMGGIGRYRIRYDGPSRRPVACVGHTVSRVTFRPMDRPEIEAYVQTGEPLDKAGAYGVQGIGAVFIEKMEGDFFSVMGLPLNLLYRMLTTFGVSPFHRD